MSAVLVEKQDGVALITLNRPERKNAMSAELCDAFRAAVRQIAADRGVRAVVVTGADRYFCSGADIGALGELAERLGLSGGAPAPDALRELYDAFRCIGDIDVPTIAAINGHAVGGGLGLALMCDLRIIAESAKIGANFVRLGIHAGMGISLLLPRAIGYERAARMMFTGELITGSEAARIGLCLEAVPAAEVASRALDLARKIAANAPLAVRQLKRTLRLGRTQQLDAALELESFAQAELARSADAREGIAAMLGRREPSFEGK